MGSVRVAIVGVGNCASSLVQGVHYYKDADPASRVPGLMHVQFGPYHVRDVEFVAAFDVDAKKVGRDLAEAIGASENNTIKFCDVPPTGVTVQRGPTMDGLGEYYREIITESDESPADVVQALQDARADVLVSYLPVGSEEADRFYAQCAIDARVAFVNALPVFIASDPAWAQKFTDAGVPIVGDDIKSQVGATITHRVMAKLFEDRGVELLRTYQLNFGGNMDFMNMLERKRLQSKKISKTQSVTSQIPHEMARADVHIGPSDHVPWLDDRKWAYVRLEGQLVRRHPAEPGVQAGGLGLAQLGRRDHRRDPRSQDRQGPRHRRPADVPVVVLHEVAAGAVQRRPGPRGGRPLHPRRGRALARRSRSRRAAAGLQVAQAGHGRHCRGQRGGLPGGQQPDQARPSARPGSGAGTAGTRRPPGSG